jgi:hypothetical protein
LRASSSALRPSTSRRFTSLPSVTPAIAPTLLIASTSSGSGLFHTDAGVDADACAEADCGHRRTLREQLGVGADADLQVLRPHPPGDEDLLHARRLRRAGPDPAQVGPDDRLDLAPGAVGQRGVAVRALLDHALEQARDERHAARLHGLEIARRQEPRPRAVARALNAVREQRLQARERGRLPDRRADVRRLCDVEEVADGRLRARQIDRLAAAHADDRGAVLGGQPRAADEHGLVCAARQALLDRQRHLWHRPLLTAWADAIIRRERASDADRQGILAVAQLHFVPDDAAPTATEVRRGGPLGRDHVGQATRRRAR